MASPSKIIGLLLMTLLAFYLSKECAESSIAIKTYKYKEVIAWSAIVVNVLNEKETIIVWNSFHNLLVFMFLVIRIRVLSS